MLKSVYVVVDGFQDDIHAAFTQKREAVSHAKRLIETDRIQDPRIQELKVYAGKIIPQYISLHSRKVIVDAKGIVKRIDTATSNTWEYQDEYEDFSRKVTETVISSTHGGRKQVYTTGPDRDDVFDESEQRVLELRAEIQGVSI